MQGILEYGGKNAKLIRWDLRPPEGQRGRSSALPLCMIEGHGEVKGGEVQESHIIQTGLLQIKGGSRKG